MQKINSSKKSDQKKIQYFKKYHQKNIWTKKILIDKKL